MFHSKKQPRLPTANRPHPPAADTNQDGDPAGSSGQVNSLDASPGVPTSRLGDVGTDDCNGSDSNGMSEGALGDFDSDEFESSGEEDVGCETRDSPVHLEFELSAAKAGNVRRRYEILMKN